LANRATILELVVKLLRRGSVPFPVAILDASPITWMTKTVKKVGVV
jgi:hypothetical protein